MRPKDAVLKLLESTGTVVTRTRSRDPWHQITSLVPRTDAVVLDIGANTGQTALRAAAAFPAGSVHAFEPSPSTYRQLAEAVGSLTNVTTYQAAMGSHNGSLTLLENENSDMSSFLKQGSASWGTVTRETTVDVWTVDGFCSENGVTRIDVLKTDTQGFDLAVLDGAVTALRETDVILTELTFAPIYEDAPRFDSVITRILDSGFELVGIYPVHDGGRATWADAVFASHRVS